MCPDGAFLALLGPKNGPKGIIRCNSGLTAIVVTRRVTFSLFAMFGSDWLEQGQDPADTTQNWPIDLVRDLMPLVLVLVVIDGVRVS